MQALKEMCPEPSRVANMLSAPLEEFRACDTITESGCSTFAEIWQGVPPRFQNCPLNRHARSIDEVPAENWQISGDKIFACFLREHEEELLDSELRRGHVPKWNVHRYPRSHGTISGTRYSCKYAARSAQADAQRPLVVDVRAQQADPTCNHRVRAGCGSRQEAMHDAACRFSMTFYVFAMQPHLLFVSWGNLGLHAQEGEGHVCHGPHAVHLPIAFRMHKHHSAEAEDFMRRSIEQGLANGQIQKGGAPTGRMNCDCVYAWSCCFVASVLGLHAVGSASIASARTLLTESIVSSAASMYPTHPFNTGLAKLCLRACRERSSPCQAARLGGSALRQG